MKTKKYVTKGTLASLLLITSSGAIAQEEMASGSDAAFNEFYETVKGWTQGSLGKGLAVSMLLLGGAMGVARNSPMPALSGIAGAAFLSWGPDIIDSIMS